jgi:hypothetical protein
MFVDSLKELFKKDERYRVITKIISPYVDFSTLYFAIDDITNFDNDFQDYYIKYSRVLEQDYREIQIYLKENKLEKTSIMSWVNNEYWSNLHNYLLDQKSDFTDFNLMINYLEEYEDKVKSVVNEAYPDVLVEVG